MKKRTVLYRALVVALFIILSPFALHAQDLIVMETGDSLNCVIQRVEDKFVRIYVVRDGEKFPSTIARPQITSMKFGYYKEEKEDTSTSIFGRMKRWRVAARGGYSLGVGDMTTMKRGSKYESSLNNGYHLGVDGAYFFNNYFGVGARFNYYKNNHEGSIIPTGEATPIAVSNNINALYIAPQAMARFRDKTKKNVYTAYLSVGYFDYLDEMIDDDKTFKIKGGLVGGDIGLGYERAFTNNLALGAGFSYLFGRLESAKKSYWTEEAGRKKYVTEDLYIPSALNLSRLNFSLYLVFNSSNW